MSYALKYETEYSDCDMRGVIKPSAVLRLLQNAAVRDSIEAGDPYTGLNAKQAMWVIARLRFRMARPVMAGERISVSTAIGRVVGIVAYRDYDIFDGDGNQIGSAAGIMMLMDRETRKYAELRLTVGQDTTAGTARSKTDRPQNFKIPGSAKAVGEYLFTYSDADINRHVANIRYADIAFDAYEMNTYERAFISEMQINYNHECFPGETVVIERAEDPDYYYVSGTKDGVSRFDVRFKLEPAKN